MISTVIFVVCLIAAVVFAMKTRGNMYVTSTDRWGDNREKFNAAWLFKPLGIFVFGTLVSLFQPFAVERIDAGHKGIIVNLTGDNRGVQNYQYTTGWVMYNTWFKQVLEFPTYQQHIYRLLIQIFHYPLLC